MRRTLALALLSASALSTPALAQSFAAVCDTTRDQSPIDIVHPVQVGTLPGLVGEYATAATGVLFNNGGHSLQVDMTSGGRLKVGAAEYRLVEIHTHWPGEHRIRADSFLAEVHFVHANASGKPSLVLATLVRRGPRDNAAWARVLTLLPHRTDPVRVPISELNVPALAGIGTLNGETIFRYPGSLTSSPTCDGFAWLVRERPIHLSETQLNVLRDKTTSASRRPQPLDGREVEFRLPRSR